VVVIEDSDSDREKQDMETASLNNGDDVEAAEEESVPDREKQATVSLTDDERSVEADDVAAGSSSFGKKRGRKRKKVKEAETYPLRGNAKVIDS
jgi:hypothetical protein